MTRRTLYVVCAVVVVPVAARGVSRAGARTPPPGREIAVVGAPSALVGFIAFVFFLLVWTGVVGS
jgi:hypothetical protein